jgi:hypothetical protein
VPNLHIVRRRLRAAVEAGIILDFTMPPRNHQGRATVWLRDGSRVNTANALETLTLLSEEADRQFPLMPKPLRFRQEAQ